MDTRARTQTDFYSRRFWRILGPNFSRISPFALRGLNTLMESFIVKQITNQLNYVQDYQESPSSIILYSI